MVQAFKSIADLAEVISGFSPKPQERKKSGQYLLLGGRNIKDGELVKTTSDSYIDDTQRASFKRAIAVPGDVIVSVLFDTRKLYVYTKDDPPAVVNNSCAIIRSRKSGDYIVSYLRTIVGQRDFLDKASKATSGTFIPRLSASNIASIQVPILPIIKLSRLGDARIRRSSKAELISLKQELKSKTEEIVRLKAQNEEQSRFYQNRIRMIELSIESNDLTRRIKHGETATLEFKSSLRWNIHKKKYDKDIENACLKTIVAFCNTKGGELLIGVADDGTILGIESDGFPNADKFQLHLGNLLQIRLVPNVAHIVEFNTVKLGGKLICHVQCKPSSREIWLKPDKSSPEHFFVRNGPSSMELTPRETVEYIKDHFEKDNSST